MKRIMLSLLAVILLLLTSCDLDIDLFGSPDSKPLEQLPDPVVSLAGGTYTIHQTISITSNIEHTNIYYTVDGTEPTNNSLLYTQEFTIYQNTVLKVIAYNRNFYTSDVKTYEYTFNFPTLSAPVISPASGVFNTAQTIQISSSVPGSEIRYTLDGSRPDLNSSRYTQPFVITSNKTVRARLFKMDHNPGEIAAQTYVINLPEDPFDPSDPAKMVFVPGGDFMMGSMNGFDDERPVHEVFVSDFYLSDRPVTQYEWQHLMNSCPSDPDYGIGNNYPVNRVTWIDALKYCNKRSIQEGLTPCYSLNQESNPDNWPDSDGYQYEFWFAMVCNWSANGYRLPTEAEREFAARGSNQSQSYVYAGSNNIDEVAWYFYNSNGTSHPVAMKNPNELGLYDMCGNGWEWCWDTYGFYQTEYQVNPTGPVSDYYKVVRGGCWGNPEMSCRVSARDGYGIRNKEYFIGFRVARTSYTSR